MGNPLWDKAHGADKANGRGSHPKGADNPVPRTSFEAPGEAPSEITPTIQFQSLPQPSYVPLGQSINSDAPDFVLGLLADLRAERYRPTAWWAFFARSWRRARATARAHPTLVASWGRVTIVLALVEGAALALEARAGRADDAKRALPGAVLCLALQQADVYVHLGMNAHRRGANLYPALGIPTTLTLVRQAIAGLLWGHLLAGRPVPRAYAAGALLIASATDIADGALARNSKHASFLGQYLDAAADFSVALALALTLAARRLVSRWLLALLLARWCAPLIYALESYFGLGCRVPFASAGLGKAAGVAQALALGAALVPPQAARRFGIQRANGRHHTAHLVTVALLVIAPLDQLRRLRKARRTQ